MSLVKGIFYNETDLGIIACDDTTWSLTQAIAQGMTEAEIKADAIATLGENVIIEEEFEIAVDEDGNKYVCIFKPIS